MIKYHKLWEESVETNPPKGAIIVITKNYADVAWEQAAALLAIDSPTGFTGNASAWLKNAFESLGCPVTVTEKGGILADLGGEGNGLLLAAHTDTLGAMVCEIKSNNAPITVTIQ